MRQIRTSLAVFGHLILLWPATLGLAWLLLSPVNFFYPLDYSLLNINATIAQYAPQNRFGKQNFVETDRAERERLFAAITTAINDHGAGLAQIQYHDPQGRVLGVLLTPAEVQHLTDVSRVVGIGKTLSLSALGAWLLVIVGMAITRRQLPRFRQALIGTGLMLTLGGIIVAIIGPIHVFDWFHRSVFPANHAWFFYYQDSLMTTFMQAPTLFGLIVAWWLIFTTILLLGLWLGADWLLGRRTLPQPRKIQTDN